MERANVTGFFGRLKSWMTFKIKLRQVVITNAQDFFRCCKAEYETAEVPEGTCQHYCVAFQYLHPSDIRRHQDCDLDEGIPGTRSLFGVCNTAHPLKLKVRNIPCLCPPCIADNGEGCENSQFADSWHEVQLKPIKGQNKWKHQKKTIPKIVLPAELKTCRMNKLPVTMKNYWIL